MKKKTKNKSSHLKKVIRAEVIGKKKISLTPPPLFFVQICFEPHTPTAPHGKKMKLAFTPPTPQSDPPRP